MPEITKNTALQRYEIHEEGQLLGFAAYRDLPDGVVELPHTVVEPAYEGRGVGSALVKAVLADIRADGHRVLATCRFVAAFLDRHPEYADLRATRLEV